MTDMRQSVLHGHAFTDALVASAPTITRELVIPIHGGEGKRPAVARTAIQSSLMRPRKPLTPPRRSASTTRIAMP